MQADGSDRRKLGGYGRPFWSPDGHQFLVVSFSSPREVTVIDDRPGRKSGVLKIPEHNLHDAQLGRSETIVAVIGADAPDTIALLDVSDPQDGKIKKVLWKKPVDLDLKLNYPVYSPRSGACTSSAADDKGMAIFAIEPGKAGAAEEARTRQRRQAHLRTRLLAGRTIPPLLERSDAAEIGSCEKFGEPEPSANETRCDAS